MAHDIERMRLFTRRAVLVGGLKMGLFSILAGRLYYLQIVKGDTYRTLAEENRINLRLVAPPRGLIIDRSGAPLAINQQTYRVVLLPEQIDNLPTLLNGINEYVPLTDSDRKRIERDLKNNNSLNAILAHENLTWDQVATLSLHTLDLPGVDIEVGGMRAYPYGDSTAHVLGYIGAVAEKEMNNNVPEFSIPGFRIGKSGIERRYDSTLRGTAGHVQMEVNAHGRVVRELARTDPLVGHDLALTLDIGLQQMVQKRLSEEASAAAVVMNVETGAVYALVSHPGFDPNLFTNGIGREDWDKLNNDEHTPLLNKAVDGMYAPGSTFKVITALAALEAGIMDPDSRTFCPGHYDLGDHRFHCWKHDGHGHMDFVSGLAGSCDTYFYDLGHRTGIDRIQAMAIRLGLGEKTGIDMPHERKGLMPGRAWKMARRNVGWQKGETLIAAIGQGATLTTPLQLAVMAARIANGGKEVKPHLVRAESGHDIPAPVWADLGLSATNLELVRTAMSAVVNQGIGTAYGARIMNESLAMAGKTGTAQVRRISMAERAEGVKSNEDLPWKERDHALFVGFAPVTAPRYAVAVVIEHGGSGAHKAAPMARDILLECQKRNIG